MIFEDTAIPGLRLVRPRIVADARGAFVKTYSAATFAEVGLPGGFAEHYHSSSRAGVIRGMHLQTPPHDHEKLVICTIGRVLDVVVDLRRASPAFGRTVARELDQEACSGFVIPRGCAHGFLALTEGATLNYFVTSGHAPAHDTGVRFDSIGFPWPVAEPIVSARDRALPALDAFDSPF